MHYIKTRTEIANYLEDYQKSILDYAFAVKHENEQFEIDKTSDFDFQKSFPYPLRMLVNENIFGELNHNSLLAEEKVVNVICRDDTENRSVPLRIYKSSFNLAVNLKIINNEIQANNPCNAHEILITAGWLGTFAGLSFLDNKEIEINDNFIDLPYSARRYMIESILLSEKPSQGFFFLDRIRYLEKVLPEVAAGKNLSQNKFHQYDIFEHLVRSCDAMESPDIVLRFASLLHDIGKVPTRRVKENGEATFYNHEVISSFMLVPIMKRFGIPKPTGLKIKYYVRNHMFHYTEEWSDKAIRRFLRKVSREDLSNLILLRKSDRLGSGKKNPFPRKLQMLIDHIDDIIMRDMELKVTDLEINGLDLMKMGLSEGPRIGKILTQLLSEVKNEITPNKHEDLMERAKTLIFNTETEILVHRE